MTGPNMTITRMIKVVLLISEEKKDHPINYIGVIFIYLFF